MFVTVQNSRYMKKKNTNCVTRHLHNTHSNLLYKLLTHTVSHRQRVKTSCLWPTA